MESLFHVVSGMDFLKPELRTHPQQGQTGCVVRNWAMEQEDDDDGRRDGPLTKGGSDGIIRGRKKRSFLRVDGPSCMVSSSTKKTQSQL